MDENLLNENIYPIVGYEYGNQRLFYVLPVKNHRVYIKINNNKLRSKAWIQFK